LTTASVPSRAEILLELTEEEAGESGHKGHAAWLASGLKIQEMQYGFHSFLSKKSNFDTKKMHRLLLQALVRKIGSHLTPDQKRDIVLRHSWLQDKVDTFQNQAGSMLHAVSNDAMTPGLMTIHKKYTPVSNLMVLVKKMMMGTIWLLKNTIKCNC
jgi:hypothetical protein